jgi:hypothetical protein
MNGNRFYLEFKRLDLVAWGWWGRKPRRLNTTSAAPVSRGLVSKAIVKPG